VFAHFLGVGTGLIPHILMTEVGRGRRTGRKPTFFTTTFGTFARALSILLSLLALPIGAFASTLGILLSLLALPIGTLARPLRLLHGPLIVALGALADALGFPDRFFLRFFTLPFGALPLTLRTLTFALGVSPFSFRIAFAMAVILRRL
jgi:hypothetical protein